MDDMTPDIFTEFQFGLKQRLYNWNLRALRLQRGWKQQDLAAAAQMSKGRISRLETLRAFPSAAQALKLSEILDCPVEVLFPDWLKAFKLKKVPPVVEEQRITLEQAANSGLLGQTPALLTSGGIEEADENLDQWLRGKAVEKTLAESGLTSREQYVIERRFGLGGTDPLTRKELGAELYVSRERIHQIEHRALQTLRHPENSRKLVGYLE